MGGDKFFANDIAMTRSSLLDPECQRCTTFIFLLILIFGFGTPGISQDHTSPSNPIKQAPTTNNAPVRINEIIKMVKAGLSDETIILQIKKRGRPFNLTANQLIQLKAASVSENVIQAMIDPSRAEVPSAAAKTPGTNQLPAVVNATRATPVSIASALRGVTVQDLAPYLRQQRYKALWAVAIISVQPGTPAELAGIKAGDIVRSIVIGGARRPARTGTPVEFAQAVKRCTPTCLVEISRDNENNNGFIQVGTSETVFLPVYGSSSKAFLAYKDVQLQKLYKVWSDTGSISNDDMQALAGGVSGLITGTGNGEKQRTAPISIKYHPATPANPKPWSVTVGFEEDDDEKTVSNYTTDPSVEAAAFESVPRSSALHGIKVRTEMSTPAVSALQGGISASTELRRLVIESANDAAAPDLRAGDGIRAIYVAGSQPYVKTEDDSGPRTPVAFYRLAALCVPDCLIRVMHAEEKQETMLWLRSTLPETDMGLLTTNFQLTPKPGLPTYLDVRSQLAYEAATGGGVIFRDGASGKIFGAVVSDRETAIHLAQQIKSQAPATSGLAGAKPSLTAEQITDAIKQGSANPGQSQGLVLIDAGSQFAQSMAVLNSSIGNKKPWDQASASGFQITIFTPQSWVAQQASDAAQQGRKFGSTDVNDEMLRPVIRIIALPSTPPPAGSGLNFGQDVSSVGDIKLADASRKNLIEPANRKPFKHQNLSGLIAEFSLDDLARVRQKNSEFYVLVTGPKNSHEFKIKKKHFAMLSL